MHALISCKHVSSTGLERDGLDVQVINSVRTITCFARPFDVPTELLSVTEAQCLYFPVNFVGTSAQV